MCSMTTNMISAARLIAHKTVNGRYQSKLQMDQFPVLGHQMTVSFRGSQTQAIQKVAEKR